MDIYTMLWIAAVGFVATLIGTCISVVLQCVRSGRPYEKNKSEHKVYKISPFDKLRHKVKDITWYIQDDVEVEEEEVEEEDDDQIHRYHSVMSANLDRPYRSENNKSVERFYSIIHRSDDANNSSNELYNETGVVNKHEKATNNNAKYDRKYQRDGVYNEFKNALETIVKTETILIHMEEPAIQSEPNQEQHAVNKDETLPMASDKKKNDRKLQKFCVWFVEDIVKCFVDKSDQILYQYEEYELQMADKVNRWFDYLVRQLKSQQGEIQNLRKYPEYFHIHINISTFIYLNLYCIQFQKYWNIHLNLSIFFETSCLTSSIL